MNGHKPSLEDTWLLHHSMRRLFRGGSGGMAGSLQNLRCSSREWLYRESTKVILGQTLLEVFNSLKSLCIFVCVSKHFCFFLSFFRGPGLNYARLTRYRILKMVNFLRTKPHPVHCVRVILTDPATSLKNRHNECCNEHTRVRVKWLTMPWDKSWINSYATQSRFLFCHAYYV